jgi:hypothetical protein
MFVEGISMPQIAPQIIRMPVTGALSRVFSSHRVERQIWFVFCVAPWLRRGALTLARRARRTTFRM